MVSVVGRRSLQNWWNHQFHIFRITFFSLCFLFFLFRITDHIVAVYIEDLINVGSICKELWVNIRVEMPRYYLAFESWCCHIWSQYDKLFSRYSKKQFQRQLPIPPHKQTSLHNGYMEENYFTFVLRRNMLLKSVFLIDNFIKHS